MPTAPTQLSTLVLPEPPGENPHYLRSVSELGAQQEVIAHSDIYAANGMKLLAKGARITPAQFERLVQHKLSVSIDWSLSLEAPVDAAELSREAGKILEHDPLMSKLSARAGDARAIKHEMAALVLPALLETRLTVMRGTRPDLFHHSLRTAMIAFAMAQRLRLPAANYPLVLLAALCHDMGELHTDPAILLTEHRITPEERRFVHVHPITAFILINGIKDFPVAASKAILQHHERLDGSGYPYGLCASLITPLARLLAAADVAEAVIDRFAAGRMDMLLRAGRNRFDPLIVNALHDLLHVQGHDVPEVFSELDTTAELGKLANILDTWNTLSALLKERTSGVSANFLFDRMNDIRGLILQAGFDPGDIQGMMSIAADDPAILKELRDMLSEIDWLLHDLANEIARRSPALDDLCKLALQEWVEQLRAQRLTGECVIWSLV